MHSKSVLNTIVKTNLIFVPVLTIIIQCELNYGYGKNLSTFICETSRRIDLIIDRHIYYEYKNK